MAYFVVWGLVIGLRLNLGLTVAVDQVLTNWFVRKRGLAQGVKFGQIGLTGVVLLPVLIWIVGGLGWSAACVVWGAIMVNFGSPDLRNGLLKEGRLP